MDSSSFDEIFRRFQSLTGTSTQQELADVLGIVNRPFRIQKRGTVPPGWFLVLFEMRGVNPDWLKQGKGPIYLRTEDGRYMEPEPAATPLGRGVSLPLRFRSRAGRRMGAFRDDHAPRAVCREGTPHPPNNGRQFFAHRAPGGFRGRRHLLVRPSSGSIFAVSVPFEGVVIKRVFCDSDTLLLRTDNPLHPSMSIPLAEAGRLIGRVAWVFSSDLSRQRPALIPCSSRNGGRIFGCAARPVRAFRRNVCRTHGQDTRQASKEAVSRHGPASYCPEGYTPHSPWWGAEACRARKAPHILMATQEPHRLPETLLSPPVLWVRRREKAFSPKRKAVFEDGTESGSIVVKYGLIIWCFR